MQSTCLLLALLSTIDPPIAAFVPPIKAPARDVSSYFRTTRLSDDSTSTPLAPAAHPLGLTKNKHRHCGGVRSERSDRRRLNRMVSLDSDDNFVGQGEDVPTSNRTATDGVNNDESSISPFQRVRILTYRTFLITSALLLTVMAVFGSNFLSGTGIDEAAIANWADGLLPFAAGLSLLLAPMPSEGLGRAARVVTTSLGAAAVFSTASASTGVGIAQSADSFGDLQHILFVASLMAISMREIYYFGIAYKVEAVVAMLTLPLLLVDVGAYAGNIYPVAVPLCALAVDVLAVGKVFEPCREDYVKSNSEFFVAGEK
mmetsp:Transcript_354/g.472  ORF Transcript_354/g.472 Transcript_354/m.472 type:complete len:315 (-) Transcript_354:324-1268(-)